MSRTCQFDRVICNYCKKPGHLIKDCRKLLFKNQGNRLAHVASATSSSDGSIAISSDEYAKFICYQESLKHSSVPISVVADSGISNTCLVSSSSKWVIDSGATDHMTGNPSLFSSFHSYLPTSSVTLADGSTSPVLGSGTVVPTSRLPLSHVLSLPNFAFNLLSISNITTLNCSITFFPGYCVFQDLLTKQTIGKGHESAGLYILDTSITKGIYCLGVGTLLEAHYRLGHPSLTLMKQIYPQFSKVSSIQCESCEFAKHHRTSLSPRLNKRANAPFDLVHTDVWGACPVVSKSGFKYFVTFVDDYSRMTWLFFMKYRSELFTHFSAFCAEIKTQFNVPVRVLRGDNAQEYLSAPFKSFMLQHGIIHQTSCVDTPPQNGVAERKNRHLLETARALLFQMNVPKQFWADAVSTSCFLINRMPSSVLDGKAPYQCLFPNKELFPIPPKTFGCTCFVRDVNPHRTKLDPKSLKCIFLGYSRVQKGYRCFCLSTGRYLISIDVSFHENTLWSSSKTDIHEDNDEILIYTVTVPETTPSITIPNVPVSDPRPPIHLVYTRRHKEPDHPPPVTPVINYPDTGPTSTSCPEPVPASSDLVSTSDLDLPIALRKGTQSCTHPISSFVSYSQLFSASCSFIACIDSISIPKSVKEALSHPEWRHAMVEEMNALDLNGTWDLVDLPTGKKSIGCKWVFAVKVNPDGSVARLKARLVAKGYAQTYGVDYSNTFSPVAKLTYVRLLISLAATHDWHLHQLDIKNAFLHGDLQEEVYIEQPPGFVAQGEYGKVCRLRKSLYGLKQSPRAWFGKFSQSIERFGMIKGQSDHSVFYRRTKTGITLLVVYVDDIVITGSDTAGILALKNFLHSQFQTKDLGSLKYFLVGLSTDLGIPVPYRRTVPSRSRTDRTGKM
ncbi:unnamed protein product [Cuscuta epithymum]|uniref:Retrovirus-related Pol polyprotein from transposon TNT 1-94 n=1 Tax=Cuscuta epithymum TaxID=186058 RepID=A0AAV0G472_9ASTE|nr:unnamed protein product [Cuscuta epithymum]